MVNLLNEKYEIIFEYKISNLSLVSVDVERSFSIYKNLISEKRHNSSEKSIEMDMIIAYNHFFVT